MAVHARLYCVVLLSPSFSFCFCSFKSLGLEVEKEKDTEGGKTGRIRMNCLKELLLVTQSMVPRNLECLAKLSKICKILSALRNRSSNTRKRNSKKSVISSFPAVRGRKPFCKNCLFSRLFGSSKKARLGSFLNIYFLKIKIIRRPSSSEGTVFGEISPS